jgi:DNA-binding transcriptional regulator YiaG
MSDGTPILSAELVSTLERRTTITVLRDVELVSGEELRFARKVLGLRQTELAELATYPKGKLILGLSCG